MPAASAQKPAASGPASARSEEHTSELQSRFDLVCRLLLEKKKAVGDRDVLVDHQLPRAGGVAHRIRPRIHVDRTRDLGTVLPITAVPEPDTTPHPSPRVRL